MCYFQSKIQHWTNGKWKVATRNIWCNKQGRSYGLYWKERCKKQYIIQKHIKPGTEIWMDCYKGCQKLDSFNGVSPYTHKTVNYSRNFVNPHTHMHKSCRMILVKTKNVSKTFTSVSSDEFQFNAWRHWPVYVEDLLWVLNKKLF